MTGAGVSVLAGFSLRRPRWRSGTRIARKRPAPLTSVAPRPQHALRGGG